MSRDQLDEGPPHPLLSLVLPLVLAVVCRRPPLVVSQAHPLDSLDVEAHHLDSPAPLAASHLLGSLERLVVSSLLDSPALLAADHLASTLLPDDNHDNTPPKHANRHGLHRFRDEKIRGIPKVFQNRKSGLDSAALCTIA